jgi:hypothetical protein
MVFLLIIIAKSKEPIYDHLFHLEIDYICISLILKGFLCFFIMNLELKQNTNNLKNTVYENRISTNKQRQSI